MDCNTASYECNIAIGESCLFPHILDLRVSLKYRYCCIVKPVSLLYIRILIYQLALVIIDITKGEPRWACAVQCLCPKFLLNDRCVL